MNDDLAKQINRLTVAEFAALAGKPQTTARHWASRYPTKLDTRRIGARLTVDADLAQRFLAGEPLADGQDRAA